MNLFLAAVALAPISLFNLGSDAFDEDRRLRVHNDTSVYLCGVYIDHVDKEDFEDDLIGSCIAPGSSQTVNPGREDGYCMMDMLFIFADTEEVLEEGFNICEEGDYYLFD